MCTDGQECRQKANEITIRIGELEALYGEINFKLLGMISDHPDHPLLMEDRSLTGWRLVQAKFDLEHAWIEHKEYLKTAKKVAARLRGESSEEDLDNAIGKVDTSARWNGGIPQRTQVEIYGHNKALQPMRTYLNLQCLADDNL